MARGPGGEGRVLRFALLAALSLLAIPVRAEDTLPAFPGALGFGATTPGGRGGRVLVVTNLNDSGAGSLRAAVESQGPRIVVFRVGGTIVLESPLRISQPFLTIAGQTAPGGGIQLRNESTGSRGSDSFSSLVISAHDVVIRYLRIRPGIPEPDPACAGPPARPRKDQCVLPNDIDAISLLDDPHDIVIDHVSAAWATDELVGAGAVRDLTLQWSILAEGLDFMLYGEGKKHDGKGMLLGNRHTARQGRAIGRVSIHHNLWAHNSIRSPMVNPACPDPQRPSDCVADVVGNVVYNWGAMGTHVSNSLGHAFANVVGNTYKPGPSTVPGSAAIGVRDWSRTPATLRPGARLQAFVAGNVEMRGGSTREASVECFRPGLREPGRKPGPQPCALAEFSVRSAIPTPALRAGSAAEAVELVLAGAGASQRLEAEGRFVPARDAVDQRLVEEFRRGTGGILRAREALPGWPVLASGEAPRDGDSDGMPDAWERRHGLNPDRAGPGADVDGDGYTDLEEYLNGTDPRSGG